MEMRRTNLKCSVGHQLVPCKRLGFLCDVCNSQINSNQSLACNMESCQYDLCNTCAKRICPVGHLLVRRDSNSRFLCSCCTGCQEGARHCCKEGCDFEICEGCLLKARCPAKHVFFRLDTGLKYFCDICKRGDLSGSRLCCKRPGCDYDICSNCEKNATCPSGHFLNRKDSCREFFCDLCDEEGIRVLNGVRLNCSTCDFDICHSCINKYRCPAGHFLRRHASARRFHCDICGARDLDGPRLRCKVHGCDFDICSTCAVSAKCPAGHFLLRHDSTVRYNCDHCLQRGISGPRLRCRATGCDFDVCPKCIQSFLHSAPTKSASSATRLDCAAQEVQSKVEQIDFRTYWTGDGYSDEKLFSVQAGSAEENMVLRLFRQTMPQSCIHSLLRVENGSQHNLHQVYLDNMRRSLGARFDPPNMVRLLFHGTRGAAAKSIVYSDVTGFQPLLAGSSAGAVWGDGTYFARDAVFSHRYTCQPPGGYRQMLVAQVIVGRWVCGQKGLKACPLLPGSDFRRYNSLVNDEAQPSIFVVQDTGQAYPAYLISYL